MENSVQFKDVYKSYGKTDVIKSLNLDIKQGERIVLLGPSGCGKSTVLRMISGLESISGGKLYLNGEVANDVDPGDRSIAMVFQNYALFPHMTVKDNVGYGLKINKVPKSEAQTRINDALKILKLDGYEERLPRELSGGQRQRVALARALVKRGDFLLLDEPLSNLDAQLRGQARKELVSIHELYKQTFIYVTHDQIEAMTIGHRIALLKDGKIQMLDTPSNVYHHPANIFVAQFIGSPSTNIINVRYDGGKIYFESGQSFQLPEPWIKKLEASGIKQLVMGIRPEDVRLEPSSSQGDELRVEVDYIEDYGNRVAYYFSIAGQEVVSIMPESVAGMNREASWKMLPHKLHFFDGETTESVGDPVEYI